MWLLSWNVNGLRATYKNGFLDWLYNEGPDILCMQEVKAELEDLPDELKSPKGYFVYINSSTTKKGYSGVGLYTKIKPKKVENLGVEKFDKEGRVQVIHFDKFVVINAYFPNTGRDDRLSYRMEFNDEILSLMNNLKKKGKVVILCGDLNVSHEEIDLARPNENDGNAGFRPEERAWIDELLVNGYSDTLRHFYPDKKSAYSWWDPKSRARDRNVGWRLDYFFVSGNLLKKLKKAFILEHVMGSDHCPVGIELEF